MKNRISTLLLLALTWLFGLSAGHIGNAAPAAANTGTLNVPTVGPKPLPIPPPPGLTPYTGRFTGDGAGLTNLAINNSLLLSISQGGANTNEIWWTGLGSQFRDNTSTVMNLSTYNGRWAWSGTSYTNKDAGVVFMHMVGIVTADQWFFTNAAHPTIDLSLGTYVLAGPHGVNKPVAPSSQTDWADSMTGAQSTPMSVVYGTNWANSFTGKFNGDGAGISNIPPGAVSGGVVSQINGSATNTTFSTLVTLSTNATLRAFSPSGSNVINLMQLEWHNTKENILRIGTSVAAAGTYPNAIAMCIAGHDQPVWLNGLGTGGNGPRFPITFFLYDGSRLGWTINETNATFGSDAFGTYEFLWNNLQDTFRFGCPEFTNLFVGTNISMVSSNSLSIQGGGGNRIQLDNVGQAVNIISGQTPGTLTWGALGVVPGTGLLIDGNSYLAANGTFFFGSDGEVAGNLLVDSGITIGSGSAKILTGTGAPAIAAPVGSLYLRTDGAAGSTLYVKESGTGASGWVAK